MEIKDLEALITEARDAYYNSGTSILEDSEYDNLEDQLRELDPTNKLLKQVGAKPSGGFNKVKHSIPMGSLDKCQNAEEFSGWIKRHNLNNQLLVITEKLDGLSIEVEYQNGNLVRAITRGTGEYGDEVTANVVKMKGIKVKLSGGFTGSLRGEIILMKDDWRQYFQDTKNPRNAAAGTSKRLDGVGCEHLSVLFYEAIGDAEFTTYHDEITWLKDQNLNTPNFIGPLRPQDVDTIMTQYIGSRASLPYEIDGLVTRVNGVGLYKELGDLNQRPRGAIAYKFPSEAKTTTIKSVTWQVGKTGRLTPVAEIEPIDLGGTTISRVSLHTARNAISLGSGGGSLVLISRANDVIPYLKAVIQKTHLEAPDKCPECGEAPEWDGDYLNCVNPTCKSVLFGAIMVWLDRLNVLYIGESLVNTLITGGYVRRLPDLYTVDWKKVGKEVGQGVADRARESLQNSGVEMDLATMLGALNVRHCQTTARDIVKAGYNTLDKLIGITEDQLHNIEGIGPIKAKAIYQGVSKMKDIMVELSRHIKIKAPQSNSAGKLSGLSFCITGELSKPRKEFERLIQDNGGESKGSVSKGLNFLIIADPASTSSKAEKARKLGTKLLSEQQFLDMLK